jgi:uncharacterized membrane protein YqjE
MPAPEKLGPGTGPSLFVSLRSFWAVLLAIFYTRLDLLTAELEDEGIRLAKLAVSGMLSVLCLHTAFFFAMFFLLAAFWDTHYRLLVLGLIFGVYFVAGVALILFAWKLMAGRPKFLAQTLAELRRDAETLRQTVTKKETP